MKLSARIQSIEESKTVQFTSLIQNLRKQGKAVIDFAVGEPGFDPPQEVIASTKEALDAQQTRYGPVAGLPELKAKLAEAFEGYGEENIHTQGLRLCRVKPSACPIISGYPMQFRKTYSSKASERLQRFYDWYHRIRTFWRTDDPLSCRGF